MNKYSSDSNLLMWLMVVVLTGFMFGCGGGGGGGGALSAGPTGALCTGANCVPLGTAGSLGSAASYAILAKSGVATVPTSAVTGNVGLSPAAKTFLTGWSQADDVTDSFATSAQVAAPYRLYAANNSGGTTSVDLTAAVLSMEAAYTDAAGRPAGVGPNLNLGGGTVAGQNLAPGTYTWGTNVNITTDLTLTGSATDVWIFQIAGTLDLDAGKQVLLTGGAQAKNIFWVVADVVTLKAGSHIEGIILAQTNIAMVAGASANSSLLAQTAVTLDANTVTQPAP